MAQFLIYKIKLYIKIAVAQISKYTLLFINRLISVVYENPEQCCKELRLIITSNGIHQHIHSEASNFPRPSITDNMNRHNEDSKRC